MGRIIWDPGKRRTRRCKRRQDAARLEDRPRRHATEYVDPESGRLAAHARRPSCHPAALTARHYATPHRPAFSATIPPSDALPLDPAVPHSDLPPHASTPGRSAFTPFELPTAAALPGLQSQSELTAAALPPCTTSPLAARSLHPLSTPQAIPPSDALPLDPAVPHSDLPPHASTPGRSAFTPFELPTAAALPGLQSQSELTAAALPPCTTSPLAARSLHPLSTPQAIPPSVYDKPIAS